LSPYLRHREEVRDMSSRPIVVTYRPVDIDVEIQETFETEEQYAQWISECIDSVWVVSVEGLE
jgi:hypothetical protein